MLRAPMTKTTLVMMRMTRQKKNDSRVHHCSHSNVRCALPRIIASLTISTAHETGEEGETTIWTGRTKLYTMAGEGATKGWKERGIGTFKFNITVDEPRKARFVLRADGTHRLLLNAAVTKQLVFGGDSNGDKPKEGRLLFNTPSADGALEMHLLKVSGSNNSHSGNHY